MAVIALKNIKKEIGREVAVVEEKIEFEEKKIGKWFYSLIKKILGPIVRKIWIDEVVGLENFPKEGPVVFASNHQSYFDFISSIAVSPRKIHYMAAEKFYHSPLWRPLMHLTSQIRVDRKSGDKQKMFQYVYSALAQGRVLGIFPEGTRNRANDGKMQKAFNGVARIALTAKAPILPVGIIGAYEVMSAHDKLPKFNKKIKLVIGEPMYFSEYHGKELTEDHYLEVTEKVMLRISELSGKEYPHAVKIKKVEDVGK